MKVLVVGAACVLTLLLGASSSDAAVVRDVSAMAVASQTRIVVRVEGAFRYRAHGSSDGRTVHVDIESAKLDEGTPRVLPVSDSRVEGVIVQADAASGVVRVSIDLAGQLAARMEATVDQSRLILSFGDASPDSVSIAEADTREPRSMVSQPELEGSSVSAAVKTKRAANAAPTRKVLHRPVVVLDPGHGGKDPGARAWTGEVEKDIVLDLAERVARRLRKGGEVDVVMTRTGDQYITLSDRRETSLIWGADAFVSIHANASQNSSARGIETYYHSRSTAKAGSSSGVAKSTRRLARAENAGRPASEKRTGVARASLAQVTLPTLNHRAESIRLATLVQDQLVRQLGMRYEAVRDLGAKEGPFFVIGENAAPSVLVEAAFLTHREEGLRMRSEVYREQIAEGVARGILAFLRQQERVGAL